MKSRTPVVLALIAINVVMFAIEIALGADAINPTVDQLRRVGANAPPLTLSGEYWRLGAAMFLHYGVIHIGMNMLCLWSGRIVEHLYGSVAFACLYLAAGLLGGIASMVRTTAVVGAGASGAVFGVFGAFGAFIVMRRTRLDPQVVKDTSRSLVSFIGLNLIIGFSVPGIDVTAHMGGLLAGFLIGLVLLARDSSERQRKIRGVIALVVSAGVSLGAMQIIPVRGEHAGVVLAEVDRLFPKLLARQRQIEQQLDAKQLTQQQAYEAYERELIPKWTAMRLRLDGIKVVSEATLALEQLKKFTFLELDELQSRSDMLRDGKAEDPDDKAALAEKHKLTMEAFADLNGDNAATTTEPVTPPPPTVTPQ